MLYVRPDFYDDFHCLAAACRHSCCVGWEIDVDGDSLKYYRSIPGALGEELRRQIALEPSPHFRLGEDERCPFLRPDGLCRLIVQLGEDSLCDICALHPRFFNDYPGRTEVGLGLCCEEAARLLTEGEGPLRFLTESDGEGDETPTPLLKLREKIFVLLADDAQSLTTRMDSALGLLGQRLPDFDGEATAAFFLTLERMDGRGLDGAAEKARASAQTGTAPEPDALRPPRRLFGLPPLCVGRIGDGGGKTPAILLSRGAPGLRPGAVQPRRPAPFLRRDRILGRERRKDLRVACKVNTRFYNSVTKLDCSLKQLFSMISLQARDNVSSKCSQ